MKDWNVPACPRTPSNTERICAGVSAAVICEVNSFATSSTLSSRSNWNKRLACAMAAVSSADGCIASSNEVEDMATAIQRIATRIVLANLVLRCARDQVHGQAQPIFHIGLGAIH